MKSKRNVGAVVLTDQVDTVFKAQSKSLPTVATPHQAKRYRGDPKFNKGYRKVEKVPDSFIRE